MCSGKSEEKHGPMFLEDERMNNVLTITEIETQFESEWVLVGEYYAKYQKYFKNPKK